MAVRALMRELLCALPERTAGGIHCRYF